MLPSTWYVSPSSQNAHSRLLHGIRTGGCEEYLEQCHRHAFTFCLPLCSLMLSLTRPPLSWVRLMTEENVTLSHLGKTRFSAVTFHHFRWWFKLVSKLVSTSKKNGPFWLCCICSPLFQDSVVQKFWVKVREFNSSLCDCLGHIIDLVMGKQKD